MSDSVQPYRRQPTRLPRPWDSPGKNTGVGCHFLLQCMKGKVKVKSLGHVRLLATPWTAPYQTLPSMGFSKQEYWSGVPLPSLFIHPICWELKELHFYGGIKIGIERYLNDTHKFENGPGCISQFNTEDFLIQGERRAIEIFMWSIDARG